MTWQLEFLLALLALLGLMVSGLWIPFAIGLCGVLFLYFQGGINAFRGIGFVTWGGMNSATLTAVPLFILMAEIILQSGISGRFYRGLSSFVSRLPGGLLQTNVIGCAIFAAISGSSVATSASIGKVAIENLRIQKYDPALAYGSLAAGGTLGILIPPSIIMILYGEMTETSIARLFAGGVVPGLLLTAIFSLYIAVRAFQNPALAPLTRVERRAIDYLRALVDTLPLFALIALVLGGIYSGTMTPTEAAGVGAVLAALICAIWGNLTWSALWSALRHAVEVTATILFIVLAAYIFSYASELSGVGRGLSGFIRGLELSRLEFLLVIIVVFMLLGCVMDTIAMMMLVLPLLIPVIVGYEIDLIWFGIVVTVLLEIGQITPPFGINLFVIQSIAKSDLATVVRGSAPFFVLLLLFIGLLVIFPEIVTWLPSTMKTW